MHKIVKLFLAAEIKQTLNYTAAACLHMKINLIKSNVSQNPKKEKGFNKLQQIIFEIQCVY